MLRVAVCVGSKRSKGRGGSTHPWSFLDDLLVSPLNAAVPLKQVDNVPVLVPEHLHLHVPGGGCECVGRA